MAEVFPFAAATAATAVATNPTASPTASAAATTATISPATVPTAPPTITTITISPSALSATSPTSMPSKVGAPPPIPMEPITLLGGVLTTNPITTTTASQPKNTSLLQNTGLGNEKDENEKIKNETATTALQFSTFQNPSSSTQHHLQPPRTSPLLGSTEPILVMAKKSPNNSLDTPFHPKSNTPDSNPDHSKTQKNQKDSPETIKNHAIFKIQALQFFELQNFREQLKNVYEDYKKNPKAYPEEIDEALFSEKIVALKKAHAAELSAKTILGTGPDRLLIIQDEEIQRHTIDKINLGLVDTYLLCRGALAEQITIENTIENAIKHKNNQALKTKLKINYNFPEHLDLSPENINLLSSALNKSIKACKDAIQLHIQLTAYWQQNSEAAAKITLSALVNLLSEKEEDASPLYAFNREVRSLIEQLDDAHKKQLDEMHKKQQDEIHKEKDNAGCCLCKFF